jgi:DNA invertase Pin-like site-specific DNA recombinase
MKVIGYVRVSTDRQAEKGFGLDVQERAVRAWARQHGHRLTAVFRDGGVSGSNGLDTRDGLADALQSLRDRKAQGLVVPRLDRLARDLVLQETLLGEVRRLGGHVFSCSDAEAEFLVDDPADPSRRLIRQILGAVAEYERSVIALRLRAGRRRKAEQGGYAGDGSPPYGWQAVEGQLVPAQAEQQAIVRAKALRAAGLSLREIGDVLHAEGHSAKRGGRWHPQTLARVLGGRSMNVTRIARTCPRPW